MKNTKVYRWILVAIAIAVSLAPTFDAHAGVSLNHNETLVSDR